MILCLAGVSNSDAGISFELASHFKTKKEARKFASQYKGDPYMIKRIEDRIKVLTAIGDPSGQLKYFKVALENLKIKGSGFRITSKVVRK